MVSRIGAESLQVERVIVKIADLPPSLAGIKLIQLSDFHYGGDCLSESLLLRAIAASNRENPDLVLLTGDYINQNSAAINKLVLRLALLTSRAGIYAVLGNHEIWHSQQAQVTAALTSIGIQVLWNEIATPLGEGLPVVGLADVMSEEFNPSPLFERLRPEVPRLVLSHNPDTAAVLQQWRVDLQLSGHTHGGQIIIPGLGPLPQLWEQLCRYMPPSWHPWLPYYKACVGVVRYWQWRQGWHRIGSNQLYVNRGLGSYFPGRLFCPPEVTVIHLVPD